ncbi:MAG: LLM class flavin-dependent oxidoreductase [Acidimicrobiia bacterium]
MPTIQVPFNSSHSRWTDIRGAALMAEELGFDTVWLPDELVWKFPPDFRPMGTWECVSMAAAVAAVTTRIKVGSWVLSALHRNPGLTVKVAEAIDEISDGRFLFGLGSGHSGDQGKAFGYPPDKVVGRYEEALEIIIPLLRDGVATHTGQFHSAHEQDNLPRGPRGSNLPVMLAGHGPRTIRLAVKYADTWSGYATESSLPSAFTDMIRMVNQTCADQGRDPETLGKSIGVFVEPTGERLVEELGFGLPLRGDAAAIADSIRQFADMGVTMVELVPAPFTGEALETLGEVLQILDS